MMNPILRAASNKAPDFSGTDLVGNNHSLAAYRGQSVVIYFWASWCSSCINDIGNIKKVYEQYAGKKLVFISVALDDKRERMEELVARHKIPFPVLYDGKVWDNPIALAYDVHGTPTFIYIHTDGSARAAGNSAAELETVLKKSL